MWIFSFWNILKREQLNYKFNVLYFDRGDALTLICQSTILPTLQITNGMYRKDGGS